MVDPLGVALGVAFTVIAVALHYTKGTGWEAPDDISQEVLERRAATVPETDFPEPMNRSIGGGGAAAIPEDEVEYYEVEFVNEGETIEVANNETILDAGEDEGWDLPYACRQGQCVSCAGQIQDGPSLEYIRHENNEALFDDDMEDGYCLTCVAYPVDEFSIKTSEQP